MNKLPKPGDRVLVPYGLNDMAEAIVIGVRKSYGGLVTVEVPLWPGVLEETVITTRRLERIEPVPASEEHTQAA